MDYVAQLSNILNPDKFLNCTIGSKVTAVLAYLGNRLSDDDINLSVGKRLLCIVVDLAKVKLTSRDARFFVLLVPQFVDVFFMVILSHCKLSHEQSTHSTVFGSSGLHPYRVHSGR